MPQGNRPRWSSSGIKSGIESVYFRKYKNFIDYVYQNFTNIENYIFRGHRKDTYNLESTLDRRISNKQSIVVLRNKQLLEFKLSVRGKRGDNPIPYTEDKEWWSLGQHYGLYTPLLDWTHSPFVAAYFTFYKTDKDDTQKRVIIALNKKIIDEFSSKNKNNEIQFFTPTSDENPRVINQNGLFTFSETGIEIEKWIKREFEHENKEKLLIKFYIPNNEREYALESLETMNINHITLFPDISGASIYTNMKLKDIKQREMTDEEMKMKINILDKVLSNHDDITDNIRILRLLYYTKFSSRTENIIKRKIALDESVVNRLLNTLISHGLIKKTKGKKETSFSLSSKGLQIFEG